MKSIKKIVCRGDYYEPLINYMSPYIAMDFHLAIELILRDQLEHIETLVSDEIR